jgi:divalent metal cation (Fe/Co/Zn/Cd) transporter
MSTRELTVIEPRQHVGPPARSAVWLRAARQARMLSWFSLAWMGAEGAIAITAGILAGSIALIGFGIDSGIEGFASIIIIWRFTGWRLLSHAAEERAQRLVAVQFFLLAPYVTAEAIHKLVTAEQPETSWLGIGLTASSLIGMPLLGIAKHRLADKLGSVATRGEGTQNLLCAYLAGAVLIGLLGNTLFGLWWLDPVAALFIAAVAVKEGRESWSGEGCCSGC